ncbi:MAG TPA: DUF4184 family protein [Candidatus Brocadiia bacterium]|nr:DUF4184 family protein [Candidatus Brocadiia bacterium]
MPPAFPSHQGLIAPLWRRWPERFNALALCVGAAVPDVVDGLYGTWRGYLGQSYGHTLIGLVLLCLPAGLMLMPLVRAAGASVSTWGGRYGHARTQQIAAQVAQAGELPGGMTGVRKFAFLSLSVFVGAFSHLFFDFISHGHFLWLYPWYENNAFFPSWWHAKWAELAVPGYRNPYPVGPHFMAWLFLAILGAVMFFRPALRRRQSE